MFTASERIVKNGVLVAYAGETMSDEEARARGLAGGGAAAAAEKRQESASPMDESWAEAAGMGVGEVAALWEESPASVLEAIKANLAHSASAEAQGAEADGPHGGEAEGEQKPKPTKTELKAECDARGIKYPKKATAVQLAALLGE